MRVSPSLSFAHGGCYGTRHLSPPDSGSREALELPQSEQRRSEEASVPRSLFLLLAVAVGIAVANLYYAQPLAAAIAADLHAGVAEVGTTMTLTQVGYALGMILLVPLGDGRERRSVIVATSASSVVALLLVARSSSIATLAASSFAVGVASSVVQMMIPYAVALVPPAQRGRVVGGVMAGLLTGILLSRTASGALGAILGWRAVFLIAATAMAVLTVVLRVAMPRQEPAERLRWSTILRSLVSVLVSEPTLQRRALVGAFGMGSFSIFWSMLSFHLADLGYGSATAGLFGAIGVVGVFVAPIAGRLAVGPSPARINMLGLAVAAASFALFVLGARSLAAIGLGVVLLDAGVQASHLTNQTVIFGMRAELRNRLNALYMVSYFAGGALGTFVGSIAWAAGGWRVVCATGAAVAALGVLPLLGERARRPAG
jgi:predicted MFS family arabinose efflux permease